MDGRQHLPPGTIINRKYSVLGLVGSGAFGSVYRVHHLIAGRERALKILHPHLAQDEKSRARFIREARVLLDLGAHPNLVATHDVDRWAAGGTHPYIYIDMDYCPGESLLEVLRRRQRLPAAEAVPIAAQVLRALHHAHGRGVVHRDVKPSNILVVNGEHGPLVKVLDFGVAGFLGHGPARGKGDSSTYPRGPVGTWPYMSPEQVEAGTGARRPDGRADLYGVGVVLFEMLTGRLPFPARTLPQLLRQILHDPPPTFAEVGIAEEWAGLEAAVHRALAKDPKARPQSAREMADGLDGLGRAHRPLRRGPAQSAAAAETRKSARRRPGGRPSASGPRLDPARVLRLYQEWRLEDLGRELDEFVAAAGPEDFRAATQVACACLDCALVGEAERVLTRAMTLAATEADRQEIHGLLAEAYLERQTPDAAAREVARLPATSALALHLRGRLALGMGRPRAAWQYFRRAEPRVVAASPLGQKNRLCLGFALFRLQRPEEAGALFDRLRAERKVPPQVQGECLRFLAVGLGLRNQFYTAFDLFRQALQLLDRAGLHFHRARVLRSYGMTLLSEGEHAYARDRLQDALAVFERLHKTRDAAITCSKVGHTYLVIGDTREAIAWYQKDHQTSLQGGLTEGLAHVQLNLGRAYRMQGDLDAARAYLRDAVAAFERIDPGYALGLALYESAYCAIKQGELKAGGAFLERCQREFQRGGRGAREGWTQLLQALLLWRRRREVETANAFEQAIHVLRAADRDFRLAEAYLEYGRFLDERGDRSAAADKLSAAIEEASLRGLEGIYRSAHALLQRIDPLLTVRIMLKSFQARDLLDSANEALLGKRESPRRVDAAVLFADIRGFTPLVATLDVAHLGDLIDRFWRRMDAAVKREGGVLDKFIGDCVMAVFPADGKDEEHCRRAVQAARRMVEEVQIGNHAQPDYQIAVGVGIHAGAILWGVFGSAHRMAHTAMGDVVNLAARIQGVAPENSVLVSEDVRRRVDGHFRWALHARSEPLKGIATPVDLWRLQSEEEK